MVMGSAVSAWSCGYCGRISMRMLCANLFTGCKGVWNGVDTTLCILFAFLRVSVPLW